MNIRSITATITAAGMFLSLLVPAVADSFSGSFIPAGAQIATDDTAPAAPAAPACMAFNDIQFMEVMTETWQSYEGIKPDQIVAWSHDPAVIADIGPASSDDAIKGWSVYITGGDKLDGDGRVWVLVFDGDGCYQGGLGMSQAAWQSAYDNANKPATAEAPKA